MNISSSLKHNINNLIKDEFDIVRNNLISIDFNDDYINKLVNEVTITSQKGKLLRPILTLLIGNFSPN